MSMKKFKPKKATFIIKQILDVTGYYIFIINIDMQVVQDGLFL